MAEHWNRLLREWSEAGLIDATAAARIREFEEQRSRAAGWRWPLWIALGFGALMLGSGVLLFVAAHWDQLGPGARFGIVAASVGLVHLAAAVLADRFPSTASALHAVGTVALGGGVFLAGQIFNMAEHWPGGFMLWTVGAAAGWVLLRDWPQITAVAALAPIWLGSEWIVAAGEGEQAARVLATGAFLTALTYFTSCASTHPTTTTRALRVLGTMSLVPVAVMLAILSSEGSTAADVTPGVGLLTSGWIIAIGVPLLVTFAIHRTQAWPLVVAAVWVLALLHVGDAVSSSLPLYVWWGIGAIGLVAWGVRDGRSERINLGAAVFAATVLSFYFAEVMTKVGRSTSLIGLGLLFLAGGWALERGRRRLVQQSKGAGS
jgi:uncharacterized membrane protein